MDFQLTPGFRSGVSCGADGTGHGAVAVAQELIRKLLTTNKNPLGNGFFLKQPIFLGQWYGMFPSE